MKPLVTLTTFKPQNYQKMKNLLIYTLLLFTILGCTKDEEGTTEEPILETTLTTETSDVMPLGYVIVNTEIQLQQNEYEGTFGGQDIKLYKSAEKALVFNVPELNPGNQTLELKIDGSVGRLSFQVLANEVSDPNAKLTEELINPMNTLNQNIEDYLANNSFSEEVSLSLTSAKAMLNDFMKKFNTLSDAEKMEIAQFYNANPFFTTDFLNVDSRNLLTGNSDYDCFDVNAKRVVVTTATVLGFVAALPALNAAGPLGSIAALSGFIAGVYAAQSIISAAHELLLNDCFMPFEHALSDVAGNTDDFEVNNDTFHNFKITTSDRHIVASDLSSSNAFVALLMRKIKVVTSKWNTLKTAVNTIILSTTNWFSDWFGSSSSNYKAITYEYEDIPETSEVFESEGDSEFITIADFPSDVELTFETASDSSIDLKLVADESTLPRTVTGKIIYDDGTFVTEDEFSVTLEKTVFKYEGTWIVHWMFDDGTPSQNDRYIFDEDGYAEYKEYDMLNGNGYITSERTSTLRYDSSEKILYLSPTLSFNVNSVDDTVFTGTRLYGGKIVELHRQ